MTKLVILSPLKQRDFDIPSKLNSKKRALFFSLNHEILEFVKSLRTPTNQVGFVLQLGYFRSNGKFFTQQHFKSPDIDFVMKMLNISPEEINLSTYVQKTPIFHRQKILKFLQWGVVARTPRKGVMPLCEGQKTKWLQGSTIFKDEGASGENLSVQWLERLVFLGLSDDFPDKVFVWERK